MKVELRGLHKLKIKGRTYYYAWRGGPRVHGDPGTPEFMASYNQAIEDRRTPELGRFKSVVVRYKASPDYKKACGLYSPAMVALARSACRLFRRTAHCPIQSTRENTAGNSALAKSMGR